MDLQMHQDNDGPGVFQRGQVAWRYQVGVPRAAVAVAAMACTAVAIGLFVVWPAQINPGGELSETQSEVSNAQATPCMVPPSLDAAKEQR
jgi:hypothetical protein